MTKPLTLYAIQVTHTRKGKPRKRRVYMTWSTTVSPEMSTTWWYIFAAAFPKQDDAESWLPQAEKNLGCKCRIVEFVEKRDA